MTVERIFEHYSFLNNEDRFQHEQLAIFEESVFRSLDEENVDKIVKFLSDYDIDMCGFFLGNIDSFMFDFETEFKPAWLALIEEYDGNIDALLGDSQVLFDKMSEKIR